MRRCKNNLPSNVISSFPGIRIQNTLFNDKLLTVALNDGHIIIFPCQEMKWITQATPKQHQDFEIESDGYGVWWNELDDGIALHHILSPAMVPGLAAVA